MNILEVVLFIVAVVGVIALGIWKSRDEDLEGNKGATDYFLAGRGLTWWLVGFSLIAANISTEQFVGMSGASANWLGMAIASYEWLAAVTLIIVAFWFLPKFLKAGLYTIPEFLEYRFDGVARLAMAIPAIVTLVFVTTSSVIFSGAKFVSEYYNTVPVLNSLTTMCWLIAIFAAVYVFIGGLKACAWTDLIWGAALIIGGAIVMFLAFSVLAEKPAEELILTKVANSDATVEQLAAAGPWERFMLLNDGVDGEAQVRNGPNGSGGKVHMVRPKEDSDIPWTALMIGLWIPNFFYWGLNQYIVQRTLGSKSLAEGQKGIVFAAFLKLLIPFLVVIPGILAYNLFSGDLLNASTGEYDYDRAFPVLVRNLIQPLPWLSWFVLAALCGAVISSLASMLNSASTIATMDLYSKFTKEKDPAKLVKVGRFFVVLFVILAGLVAPALDNFTSIFAYIQEFQGFISPGILAVFIFGFFSPRTPRYFGAVGIGLNVISYGAFKWAIGPWLVSNGWWYAEQIAFLDRMAICFFIVLLAGVILTLVKPMEKPVIMPVNDQIELETSPGAKIVGIGVVLATVALYLVFW
ncbi:sodium/solute symporter [Coraliomargarita sp. SDUM461003]|uniref:Sodium/solute symporter n=1 Tax=Thalassobacterium maritimum TaxID=3041265 RepID=A0ABU1ATP5_9BACT|nr:sodium/solute symporter [Coraliomargarita sp. SDUM461003]MDQ8207524.1 sodium/solute symporter [Coraliomargarita sp. SDUM461003]